MRLSGAVTRRLGRFIIAVVIGYVLWIMLSALSPSENVARIAWFALLFAGVVAVSRVGDRRTGGTTPDRDGEEVADTAAEDLR